MMNELVTDLVRSPVSMTPSPPSKPAPSTGTTIPSRWLWQQLAEEIGAKTRRGRVSLASIKSAKHH
jgi:hypothetical protein